MSVAARAPELRFWPKVGRSGGPNACWLWLGARHRGGYGHFYLGGGRLAARFGGAHRFAYHLLRGEPPSGLILDHLCRNPRCVNPAHLEAVTYRENIRRGLAPWAVSERTHECSRGHDLAPANLIVERSGARRCRACRRVSRLAAYAGERQRRKAARR